MPAVSLKPLDESSIGQAEKEAAAEVRKMVQALEKAIGVWEKAGQKPPELSPDFAKYKTLLRKLKEWGQETPAGFEDKLARLRALAALRTEL